MENNNPRFLLQSAQLLLLVAIPVLLLITSLNTVKEREKAWYGGGYDPEYAYLFNSLNIARFRLVGHIDHPGTPMQVFGGLVLEGSWLLDPQQGSLTEAVLRDPEKYVQLLNRAVAWLTAFAFLVFPAIVFLQTKRLWAAILLQLAPFISGFVLYNGFTRVTQEAMLMIASLAMASVMTTWWFGDSGRKEGRYPLIFGIVTGFGIASKILFGPLALIPVLLLSKRGAIKKYLLFAMLSFIAFTLPVVTLYPNMAYWILKLFIFTGQYGSGPVGVVDTGAYLPNLRWLVVANPVLAVLAALSIIFAIVSALRSIAKNRQFSTEKEIIFAALSLAIGIGYLVVAKQPKESYLLSYEMLSPVVAIVFIDKLLPVSGFRKGNMILPLALVIVLSVITIPYGLAQKGRIYSPDKNGQWSTFYQATAIAGEGTARLMAFPGSSPEAALYFGNAYSHWRYSGRLTKMYPDVWFMDLSTGEVYNWFHQPVDLRILLLKYQGKIMASGPVEAQPMMKKLLLGANPNATLTIPYSDDKQMLLAPEVKTIAGKIAAESLLFSSAETGSSDAAPFIGKGFRNEGLISALPFSGNWSLKTTADAPYAFTTEPLLMAWGDRALIEVFAQGKWSDLFLVASEPDSLRVLAQTGVKLKGDQPWHRIQLIYTETRDSGRIFFYALNAGRHPAWFDDFSVKITRFRNNDSL